MWLNTYLLAYEYHNIQLESISWEYKLTYTLLIKYDDEMKKKNCKILKSNK